MTDISFSGQTVIVTGAGRNLGRSHTLEFARRGAAVVVNDIDQGLAEAPALNAGCAGCASPIEESVAYAREHPEDQPEIRDWVRTDHVSGIGNIRPGAWPSRSGTLPR
jgi:NAD(P)-dependent dehydrogenase (short-subunit alcohol dehydrogenase family)